MVICYGVGTHLGYNDVMKALELGLEILLRVPHLSHILQGEDTVNFKELRAHWRRNKTVTYTKINPPTSTARCAFTSLGFRHFMPCFKPAWDHAFTHPRNLEGWRLEGIIPFTRAALWKHRGAPSAKDKEFLKDV